MKSMSVRAFLVLSLVILLAGAAEAAAVPDLPSLRQTPEADRALKEGLSVLLARNREQTQRGVSQEEVDLLSEIVRKHRGSSAALRAQFLLGNVYLNEGRPEELARGKPYFEVIVRDYPQTVEAALAKVQLSLLELRDIVDTQLRHKKIADAQEAITGALPFTREVDEDQGELAQMFKARTLGRRGDKFTPRLSLDLAGLLQMDGRSHEAKAVLRGIIDEYPQTVWAEKADRRLKSVEREEAE